MSTMRSEATAQSFDSNFNEVTMARKAFTPTEEQRRLAQVLSSYGIRQADIGAEVGLQSPKTLRKHFREELDRGRIGADIKVAMTLYRLATSGKHVSATIYWLSRRAGWNSKTRRELLPTSSNFVVALDKEAA
jgi:hypothetical protein